MKINWVFISQAVQWWGSTVAIVTVRFIEEPHSLFFCDARVYDAQNTYQPLWYSFGLCLQVLLLIRVNKASFETVCQCMTIGFHLSAVSYTEHSFTQFHLFQASPAYICFLTPQFLTSLAITRNHVQGLTTCQLDSILHFFSSSKPVELSSSFELLSFSLHC